MSSQAGCFDTGRDALAVRARQATCPPAISMRSIIHPEVGSSIRMITSFCVARPWNCKHWRCDIRDPLAFCGVTYAKSFNQLLSKSVLSQVIYNLGLWVVRSCAGDSLLHPCLSFSFCCPSSLRLQGIGQDLGFQEPMNAAWIGWKQTPSQHGRKLQKRFRTAPQRSRNFSCTTKPRPWLGSKLKKASHIVKLLQGSCLWGYIRAAYYLQLLLCLKHCSSEFPPP